MQNGEALKRMAVFVDVQNIYYTTRQAYGKKFNYRALWRKLTSSGDIVFATAYAIASDDPKQQDFQHTLRQIGFNIKHKPYIQRSDGSAKGDWDVGITIDVLELAPKVDTIVLLSGDGDFDLLLDKVRRDFQVEAQVYGVPALTANSLVAAASVFHEIGSDLVF